MTATDQQLLIQDLFAALTGYDLATLHLLLTPELACHVAAPGGTVTYRGVEELVRCWATCSGQGSALTVEAVMSGEGHAAAQCSAGGAKIVVVLRLEAGRVAEVWVYGFTPPASLENPP